MFSTRTHSSPFVVTFDLSWQIGGDNMFEMMYEANFTYDSSMPIYENRPPAFPYTLDYKMAHDCMIPPCPEKSYPGKNNRVLSFNWFFFQIFTCIQYTYYIVWSKKNMHVSLDTGQSCTNPIPNWCLTGTSHKCLILVAILQDLFEFSVAGTYRIL